MKLTVLGITLTLFSSTALVGYSSTSLAESCYTAEGEVNTENVTSFLQIGDISLTLGGVFSESGSLVGNITGADGFGATILAHKARFPKGDSFVTKGDRAVLVDPFVRFYDDGGNLLLDEEGQPCSFWIHEAITEIDKGTGFFKDVTSVEIFADGYISNCPNENQIFLS